MRLAMFQAEVGDDVYEEDPTVKGKGCKKRHVDCDNKISNIQIKF